MESERAQDLINGYLRGSLDAADADELVRLIAHDERLRAVLVEQRAIDRWLFERQRPLLGATRVLAALATATATADQVMTKVRAQTDRYRASPSADSNGHARRRPWQRPVASARPWMMSIMAILVVIVAGAWWVLQHQSSEVVEIAFADSGSIVLREGRTLAATAHQRLMIGDRISTPADTATGIVYGDGSTLRLNGGTFSIVASTADSGKNVLLIAGELQADIRPQAGRPMVIRTPHARMTVIGTRFTVTLTTLTAQETSTRLAVAHGRVRFERFADHSTIEVTAGGQATAPEKGEKTTESGLNITAKKNVVVPTSISIAPVADGYALAEHPSSSFGSEQQLLVTSTNATTSEAVSCVKFVIAAQGKIRHADLVLHRVEGGGIVTVYRAAQATWDEASLRWYHLPQRDEKSVASVDTTGHGEVHLDVSSALTTNGEVTLMLVAASGARMAFASREVADIGPLVMLQIDPSP